MSHDIEDILSQLRGEPVDQSEEVEAELEEAAEGEDQAEETQATAPVENPVPGLAKSIGRDQDVADELWKSDVAEAKLLAARVADPEKLTMKAIKALVKGVDSNELADDLAQYLVAESEIRIEVIEAFVKAKDDMSKRIGFGTIAAMSINHPDQASDVYEDWLEKITVGADDESEEVREAVMWALMEIGKVDEYWHDAAIVLACELQAEGQLAAAIGTEAEEALNSMGPVGDRRRMASGNNSKTAKNQNNQSKRRGGKNNNRNRGRGQGQNNSGSSDAKKSSRRNGRNKRRSRAPAPKAV